MMRLSHSYPLNQTKKFERTLETEVLQYVKLELGNITEEAILTDGSLNYICD
jgi:hypothetical protein